MSETITLRARTEKLHRKKIWAEQMILVLSVVLAVMIVVGLLLD